MSRQPARPETTTTYTFKTDVLWVGLPLSAAQIVEIEQYISQFLVEQRGATRASTQLQLRSAGEK